MTPTARDAVTAAATGHADLAAAVRVLDLQRQARRDGLTR